ncbi:MAG TPA: beta-propeller fold lactonase family protein [Nitrospira sp.]|nr:beta-propeller fold lactonase family protein [Nitrospira sp.]
MSAVVVRNQCRKNTRASHHRGRAGLMVPLLLVAACSGGGDNGSPPPSSNNSPPPNQGGTSSAPQFAYVSNSGADTLQAYAVDSNGNFQVARGQGPQPTGVFPHHVDVEKKNRFVYISNHDSNFVSGYKINSSDGTLSPINPSANASPVTNLAGNDPTDNNPHSSVSDANGQFLYVVSGLPPQGSTVKTYTINGDGTLTQIGTTQPIAQCQHGHNMTASPNDLFVFIGCEDSGMVFTFSRNTATGQLTNLGPTAIGGAAPSVAVDPGSRFLFVGTTNSVSVFNIGSNGTLTPIQNGQNNFAAGNSPHSLTVDPTGQFLYTANINSASISAFHIDQTTGALTQLAGSPFTTGGDPNYVLVHPDGKNLYTADASNVNGNDVSHFTVNADGTLARQANTVTSPPGSGTNGIGMTRF